jgi:hypothetical protein
VAKKKDSVALFEVISKSRQREKEAGLDVPAWMREHAEDDKVERVEQAPDQRAHAGTSARPEPGSVHGPATSRAPTISTAGERLTFSLNYVSAAVAGAGLILLLMLAFWVGWALAPDQAPPGPGDAQQAGLAGAAQAGNQVGRESRTDMPQPIQRTPGEYYLVIQGLQGTSEQKKQEAYDIVDYLAANELRADVRLLPGQNEQYIVWGAKGFESPRSRQAQNYMRTIEALGERYGRYNFKQREEGWWLKQP